MQSRCRRRAGWIACLFAMVASLGAGAGCGSPPAAEGEPSAPEASTAPGFSGARALELARALGADPPRARLREELENLGLEFLELTLEEGEESSVTHLLLRLEGRETEDAFLLAAPYLGSWADPAPGSCEAETGAASGAALLVELARSLVADPLPYAVWLAWLDEGVPPDRGSALLHAALTESHDLQRIRLAIFFSGVAERELVVARDLYSHRTFRERFFRTASRLGREDVFPPLGEFDSPVTGHRAFLRAGFRSVLAIASEPPPPAPELAEENGEPDSAAELEACSAESLDVVGEVVLAGLEDVSQLLLKVDRFVRRPPEPAAEPPEAVEPAESPPQADPLGPESSE